MASVLCAAAVICKVLSRQQIFRQAEQAVRLCR